MKVGVIVLKKIDNLGRLSIPSPMRKQLNIKTDDAINIEVVDDKIILTKAKKDDRIERAIECIEYDDDGYYTLIDDYTNEEIREKLKKVLSILGNRN